MSEYTIRPITVRGGTVVVQADPSQSVGEAVAAADAAAASALAASADATSAAANAASAFGSANTATAAAAAASLDADDAAASAAAAASVLAGALQADQNLSDVDSAAAARTNLGVPPLTRAITAGTGLTGGGDLSSDRTISASIASQAQAEAGTAATVLMTPQRTRDHTIVTSIGWGQTWQTPTRAVSTSYQNTTGRPIMVAISGRSTGTSRAFQVSADNSTFLTVGTTTDSTSGGTGGACFIVPPNWYYRTAGGGIDFLEWHELR